MLIQLKARRQSSGLLTPQTRVQIATLPKIFNQLFVLSVPMNRGIAWKSEERHPNYVDPIIQWISKWSGSRTLDCFIYRSSLTNHLYPFYFPAWEPDNEQRGISFFLLFPSWCGFCFSCRCCCFSVDTQLIESLTHRIFYRLNVQLKECLIDQAQTLVVVAAHR